MFKNDVDYVGCKVVMKNGAKAVITGDLRNEKSDLRYAWYGYRVDENTGIQYLCKWDENGKALSSEEGLTESSEFSVAKVYRYIFEEKGLRLVLNDLPDWAQWLAIDKRGDVIIYETKPEIVKNDLFWSADDNVKQKWLGKLKYAAENWRDLCWPVVR